jgi:hypothetical protein
MSVNRRPPWVAFERAVSLQLDLRAPARGGPAGFDVRELGRADVEPVLGPEPALARSLADLDAVAPSGWRCFAVFEAGAPVHATFVELRPGRPLSFGSVTVPRARGRGAFRAAIALETARLGEAGEVTLFGSASGANRASLRATAAAGFVVVRRTYDLRVRGVSLRGLARRLLGGLKRRC